MNGQLTLSDAITSGIQGREQGMQQAEAHASEEWKEHVMLAICLTAVRNQYFTSALVWEQVNESTHEPRAMGCMMRHAKKNGWIEPTDQFVASTRPSRHRAPLRVWKSNIYLVGVR
jgi:hypothetical protein